VTFGFCEVVDATRWWAAHRLEAAAAMARHDALVGSVTGRHGGYVFATGGDSFGVAFHRAADALAWAVELQSGIGGQRWPGGAAIQVRVGLHTG
jgi:class 3 adenylate cyclase